MVASSLKNGATKIAPHAAMILVQLIAASYIVLSKVILVDGISSSVYLVYQFILATIFMAVLAFFLERITIPQNLVVGCLYFISSTIEASVFNLVPVFTYILSVISRQEALELNTWWGRGKIFGTLLSVSGALTLMLWRGSSVSLLTSTLGDWLLGLFMVLFGILSYSAWILMLRPMMEIYPAEFSLTAIMFFFGTLQTSVVAAILSREASDWKLKWDLELLSIVFGGVLNSGLAYLLLTWGASIKGPIFVAAFTPLTFVFAAIMETTLGSTLYLGSIVGSIVIVLGLYIYLWSKSKEEAHSSMEGDDCITSSLLP
ncbi:PREDICTED: WAT1-related protein At3g30340-like isoform X2 [Nelumbo nucifera]|uniref:WAT1-related protein n=2 Tax=Nelumbo nucifera TaxID=4432 RepID=A0A822XY92_NELNU|nr:PREDICTED: WAT1-related protein At3g30340-like isoform X2 [Nelumbo nucifera]DAD25277.1 TPA_asm: hypothetical protein HUJ06_026741 [Nelumbo nucifera]